MSFRILLVDPDSLAAAASEHALVQTGYRVAPVGTFEEATRQMSRVCPDLIVTKARLGAFNGLHLLLRCRADYPDVPVIIVGTSSDHTSDMIRFGAEFVTSPIEHAPFLELVASLLSGRTPYGPTGTKRGPRKRVARLASASDHPVHAVEFVHAMESGYGGLPVEAAPNPGDGARILLPGPDLTRRWLLATRRWSWTVDSLN
jgi:DNA-binding response OmpR family regulator